MSRNLSVESFADFENSKGKEWKERVSKQNKCGTRVQTSLWKFEKVSALFKKNYHWDPNNYRPITLLPTLSKILEKQLHYFLNENKNITSKQFGFGPKLSTNTALTHFSDKALLNMDSGRLTGAVFLDLS